MNIWDRIKQNIKIVKTWDKWKQNYIISADAAKTGRYCCCSQAEKQGTKCPIHDTLTAQSKGKKGDKK